METVGAIVATHPPASCPPFGQSRTCLLRRSYGGDEGTVSDAFDAVTEGMVLGDEMEQHGGLLLYTGIEVYTVEGLIDLPDGALERVVLLVAEERGVTELLFQHIDFHHSVLVGGMKGLLAYSIAEKYDFILCFTRFILPLPTLSICLLMDAYFRICSTLATSTGRCM